MPTKKHIIPNYKQIGVFILFFLQLFLTVIPFANASADTHQNSGIPGNLAQNHNTPDSEDNCRFNYSEVQEYHFLLRSKRCVNKYAKASGNQSASSNKIDVKASDYYSTSSSFVIRPAYYTFLSLHNLF
jgi:hypothetical protein